MVIVDNPLEDFNVSSTGATEFPSLTGREVYDEESISTLNKLPVTMLGNFTLAGVDFDERPPIDIKVLTADLLIDGSLVYIDKTYADTENSALIDVGEQFYRITNVEIFNENHFIERLGEKIVREYRLGASNWALNDIKNYGKKDATVVKSMTLPFASLLVVVNGVGILQPYNQTYQRLEEIENTLRDQTTKTALSTIIGGATGNSQGVKDAVRQGHQLLLFPNKDITVAKVGDSRITDQLLKQKDDLRKMYFKAMSIVDIDETGDLSGVSRRLTMIPTINVVTFNRKLILRIYDELGYDGTITFAPMSLMDAKEKMLELEFLEKLKAVTGMSQEEFIKRVIALSL